MGQRTVKQETGNWRHLGIALRTALHSWALTIVALLSFIAVIIPQQKRIIEENLESKAHGISASLRDLVAADAVNGNSEAVETASAKALRRDKALAYLVFTRHDGYSLVSRRERSGPNASVVSSIETLPAEWRTDSRGRGSGIATLPPINRRVFHFSEPIERSGATWGWLHVGLSLEGYDRSVEMVYSRTALLAVLCVQLSLLVSIVYARRLLKPIVDLQSVVEAVAGGDLAARAAVDRNDELGSLARAVNSMTDALLRRDWILQSVRVAAQRFLTTNEWANVMDEVLAEIGRAADASRAYVMENRKDDQGRLLAQMHHEWAAPGVKPQISNPALQSFCYEDHGLAQEVDLISQGEIATGHQSSANASFRQFLESRSALSMILIPIHVNGEWWGFWGLDDCRTERQWTDAERASLRAAADMFGATVARQQAQDALMVANENLEERVLERTRELQDEVTAKQKACSELAQAQARLMEASRAAGKAEVATSVLHNVGNVLNSVSVSASLVADRVKQSKVSNLSRAMALVRQQNGSLAQFLTSDPKGKALPEYLATVSDQLTAEQGVVLAELKLLSQNVEHIKKIVAMQQNYASVSGAVEEVHPAELIEDALRLNAASFDSRRITIVREGDARLPRVNVDRHKVLQILINLLRNAKHALQDSQRPDKELRVSVRRISENTVGFVVRDNGIGIAPENLTRIFQHGFTTKKEGHGFGLHSGANAARELGGNLTVRSEGLGHGAEFTLELPVAPQEKETLKT